MKLLENYPHKTPPRVVVNKKPGLLLEGSTAYYDSLGRLVAMTIQEVVVLARSYA